MAAWTSTANRKAEAPVGETAVPVEGANIGLITRFGSGTSVLRPFEAVSRPRRPRSGGGGARLGELLLAEELVTEEELEDALAEQRRTKPKKPLGEILLRRGVVAAPTLVRLLAEQCQLELEEEKGFGCGLRQAIELRHQAERAEPEPVVEWTPDIGTESVAPAEPLEPAAPPPAAPRRLGELLIEKGLLTGVELDEALAEQEDSGRLLGEVVVDLGYVPMITLVNVLTEQLNGELEQQSGFGTGLRQVLESQLLRRAEAA